MTQKKSVFVIVGSAIANSSSHQLVKYLQEISKDAFHFLPLIDLKHFHTLTPYSRRLKIHPLKYKIFGNIFSKQMP